MDDEEAPPAAELEIQNLGGLDILGELLLDRFPHLRGSRGLRFHSRCTLRYTLRSAPIPSYQHKCTAEKELDGRRIPH